MTNVINNRPRPVPPPPEPERPAPPADIAEVIAAFNETQKLQYERLGAVYRFCVENRKHRVRFSTGATWTNFQADRMDISLTRHVDPLAPSIVSIE